MKKRLVLLLALIMVVSLGVIGCTKKEGDVSGEEDNVAKEQQVRFVYTSEITTFNYLVESSGADYANFIDTLVEYDNYGVVKPCIAEDWSVSEDGLVWTFNIRKGIKWYSYKGEEKAETTANDFVTGANYVLDPKNASRVSNILYVLKNAEAYYDGTTTDFSQVGVKAIDEYTLEYTLEKPVPYFLSMLTYTCFLPVSEQILLETGDRFGTSNDKIWYNGAFLLDVFEPQSKRVSLANKNYWDKENIFVKKLISTYNKEAETLAPELVLRGEVDYAVIPSSIVGEWLSDPAKADLIRPVRTGFTSYFYAFNFDPTFDKKYEPENWKVAVNNLNFRKAMFHALDRKAAVITSEPIAPEGKLTSTITPTNFAAVNGVDYVNMGKLGEFVGKESFDAKLATEFKAKAMEELKGKATFPVKIYMPYRASESEWAQRAQVVKQQMEGILGTDFIEIIIEGYPATDFLNITRRPGNYAFMECYWGPDYADPETYTDPFIVGSKYNYISMADGVMEANGKPKYDNMVEAASAEITDLAKRFELFADAEAYLIENAFVIPYSLSGKGYISSNMDPFESQYAPFGMSENRYKGQKAMAKVMNIEQFNEGLVQWEKERAEALKKSKW